MMKRKYVYGVLLRSGQLGRINQLKLDGAPKSYSLCRHFENGIRTGLIRPIHLRAERLHPRSIVFFYMNVHSSSAR
jgi:hypothetical protein